MENETLRNILLDLKSGEMPTEIADRYNISNDKVKDLIGVYFNGKFGDKLITLVSSEEINDNDRKNIDRLIEIGLNKYEIADILGKSISIVDKFILEQEIRREVMVPIETEKDYVERIILKNNAIEVSSFNNSESSSRRSIFNSKDDYYDSLHKGDEFLEERIRIFVDNNFNKNKYQSNTYNELFKFYTDFYHVSPALISTITKVLYEKRVNFVIVYFNKETKSYHYQWIWNFNDNQISIFDNLFMNRSDNVTIYIRGTQMENFIKTDTLYSVKQVTNNIDVEYNFFVDYSEAFRFLGEKVLMIRKLHDPIKLFINEYFNNGLLIKRTSNRNLCSATNF